MLRMAADPRDQQRAWLQQVLDKTQLAPYALARKASLAPQTLTEFLNNPEKSHMLSGRTIAKLEDAVGMRYGPEPRAQGMRESEAEPYHSHPLTTEDDFVRAAISGRNAMAPWRLASRAIEAAGYLPGDILVVDLNLGPRAGDVVCAQLYDWNGAKAETVFRIWEPPGYLVAATTDPKLRRIFVVDNENVAVKGVVVATIRPRQSRSS